MQLSNDYVVRFLQNLPHTKITYNQLLLPQGGIINTLHLKQALRRANKYLDLPQTLLHSIQFILFYIIILLILI